MLSKIVFASFVALTPLLPSLAGAQVQLSSDSAVGLGSVPAPIEVTLPLNIALSEGQLEPLATSSNLCVTAAALLLAADSLPEGFNDSCQSEVLDDLLTSGAVNWDHVGGRFGRFGLDLKWKVSLKFNIRDMSLDGPSVDSIRGKVTFYF